MLWILWQLKLIFFSFYSSSSPEATSSSSNSAENSVQPTSLQQPRACVTSTAHYITKSVSLYESSSSPGCYSGDKKCSVKSFVDVSKSPSRDYSRPESVQSNVNKPRLSPYQRSGEVKLSRNVPENDPAPSGSNVKSKVSWV